jgi:curved DNA-binding protein CbpA
MSAENPPQRIVDTHPVEGRDYLVDHYAVLGIPKNASEAEIKEAFTTNISRWHPDLVARADPELQRIAEFRTRTFTNARDVLLNPETKEAFDQQLPIWDGPISTDGTPIIDPSRLTKIYLQDDQTLAEALDRGRVLSGYDAEMFAYIEEQFHTSPNPSPTLTKLYREGLAKKDSYLDIQEGILNESLGISQRNDMEITSNYLEETTNRLEESKVIHDNELEEQILMLDTTRAQALSAGPINNNEDSQAHTDIELYNENAQKRFDQRAQLILSLASEREEIIKKRLEMLEAEYPHQEKLYDTFIIGLEDSDSYVWIGLKLIDDTVETFDEKFLSNTPTDELDAAIKQLYENEVNVLKIKLESGIPFLDALNHLAQKHVDK